jgi:ParB family chromosome partitioning protein
LLLPPLVQSLLLERKITMGQARPLIGHEQAETLAKMIVAKGLSARQAEALAKQPAGKAGQKPKLPEKSADIKALEKQAAEKLGLAFHIDWNEAKDRGKVTIDCQSLDQMTNLLAQLGIR